MVVVTEKYVGNESTTKSLHEASFRGYLSAMSADQMVAERQVDIVRALEDEWSAGTLSQDADDIVAFVLAKSGREIAR